MDKLTRPQKIAAYLVAIPIVASLAILVLAVIWFIIATIVASIGML